MSRRTASAAFLALLATLAALAGGAVAPAQAAVNSPYGVNSPFTMSGVIDNDINTCGFTYDGAIAAVYGAGNGVYVDATSYAASSCSTGALTVVSISFGFPLVPISSTVNYGTFSDLDVRITQFGMSCAYDIHGFVLHDETTDELVASQDGVVAATSNPFLCPDEPTFQLTLDTLPTDIDIS